MATTHLPSILQHNFTPFDIKTEKFNFDDDDVIGDPDFKWFADHYNTVTGSCSSSNDSSPISTPESQSEDVYLSGNSCNVSQTVMSPQNSTVSQPYVQTVQFNNITLNPNSNANIQGPPSSAFTPIVQTIPTSAQGSQQMQSVPIFIPSYQSGGVTYAFAPMVGIPQPQSPNGQRGSSPSTTMVQVPSVGQMPIASQMPQSPNGTPMAISLGLPNFTFAQQPLSVPPQYYQMLTQFQPLKQAPAPVHHHHHHVQGDSDQEDRKRTRMSRQAPRRVRHTRPKVIEAKGAVQCKGRNRKKGTQCRNAALMEYIGPRPIYCAEHIELDPGSLYEKCKSPYQKEVGDKKGCKEVVLKEFGLCYKHYGDTIGEIVRNGEYEKAMNHSRRITELLEQLEREASAAKKKDGDLYQRKNKLIPKFQEMKKTIVKAIHDMKQLHPNIGSIIGDDMGSPFDSPLNAPVLNLSDSENEHSVTDPSSPYDPESVKMFESFS